MKEQFHGGYILLKNYRCGLNYLDMTGGLASPPESRFIPLWSSLGAASAPCLESIPPPKFRKPIYGKKALGQLGNVESDLIQLEDEVEDNADVVVKEFLEKSLSEGGEGDTREDGESSDESDYHQRLKMKDTK